MFFHMVRLAIALSAMPLNELLDFDDILTNDSYWLRFQPVEFRGSKCLLFAEKQH
jgi:hypothetical protein